jgi:cobalt-zinc-cadmium efflux system outer membrane protein
MKLVFLSAYCSLLLSSGLSAENDQPILSLEVATRLALAANPSLTAARAQWQAMKARVPQAAAWEDLSVSFQTRAGRFVEVPANSFTDDALSLEQKIPLNGKNVSRAREASAEAVAAYEQLRRVELDVRAQTAAAYWRLANAYAQLDLDRQNETLLETAADLSRARYEAGTQTQADVLAATIERARLVENRADLDRARADARSALNVLLNRPPDSLLGQPFALNGSAVIDPHLPAAPALDALAMAYRPEVRLAQRRIEAAQARLQLTRRSWLPDPALRVNQERYNAAAQAISEVDVGVTFTVPWLNAGKYRSETSEARAGVAQQTAALEQVRAQTLGLVFDARTKAETFHRHFEVYRDEILPLARQAVAANRSGYENAKSSFADLIGSERTLRDAEAESLAHLADYHSATAELAAIVGVDLGSLPAAK